MFNSNKNYKGELDSLFGGAGDTFGNFFGAGGSGGSGDKKQPTLVFKSLYRIANKYSDKFLESKCFITTQYATKDIESKYEIKTTYENSIKSVWYKLGINFNTKPIMIQVTKLD